MTNDDKYRQNVAIDGLFREGFLNEKPIERTSLSDKLFWTVDWQDGSGSFDVAVCSTQYHSRSESNPNPRFAIQLDLQGIIDEVLLVIEDGDYFYRIPADVLWGIKTVIIEGKKAFSCKS